MNAKEAAKVLGGSVVVYVVMAACSAASGPQGFVPRGGDQAQQDGSGSGSMGDGSGSGAGDGPTLLDVLTDPVSEAQADPNQSGTRLKVNYYAGADGSKHDVGSMHDTMLNVDCYFGTASDGKTRCLPVSTPGAVTIGTQSFFADASCSQPLGVSTSSCTAAPTVISMSVANNCTTTTTSYAVGAQFTGPLYQGGASSTCTAVPMATQAAFVAAGFKFYNLGAQIQPPDPSQYVEATIQTEP